MRKRNLDVMSKVNTLEDQRIELEQQLREANRRCSELSEKLQLYATVHRIDMARLQFSPDVRAELQAEQKRLNTSSSLRLRRSTAASRATTASGLDGRTSAPPELDSSRAASVPSTADAMARPPSSAAAAATRIVNGGQAETLRAHARAEVAGSEGAEELRKKVVALQGRLAQEERSRSQAQDKCVVLAEQLLEKEAAIQKVSRMGLGVWGKGLRVEGRGLMQKVIRIVPDVRAKHSHAHKECIAWRTWLYDR